MLKLLHKSNVDEYYINHSNKPRKLIQINFFIYFFLYLSQLYYY